MKIGVLGNGDVGTALAKGFTALGHEVKTGTRGTFAEAAAFGEIVVLAVLGTAVESALREAGVSNLRGKIVIDATNPLDFAGGFPPRLVAGPDGSGGQTAQRVASESHVVKAFNTVGNAHMFRPGFPGGPPDMFICGNDAEAKNKVGAILQDFGWGVVDVGGIEAAHYLEAMCLVWVLFGARTNTWGHAFKLLQK